MSQVKIPFSFNVVVTFSKAVPEKVKEITLKEIARNWPTAIAAGNKFLQKIVDRLPGLVSLSIEDTTTKDK